MGDIGLESTTSRIAANTSKYNSCTRTRRPVGDAVGAPDGAPSNQTDPELAELVRRWPRLPQVIRNAITAMVRTVAPDHNSNKGGQR